MFFYRSTQDRQSFQKDYFYSLHLGYNYVIMNLEPRRTFQEVEHMTRAKTLSWHGTHAISTLETTIRAQKPYSSRGDLLTVAIRSAHKEETDWLAVQMALSQMELDLTAEPPSSMQAVIDDTTNAMLQDIILEIKEQIKTRRPRIGFVVQLLLARLSLNQKTVAPEIPTQDKADTMTNGDVVGKLAEIFILNRPEDRPFIVAVKAMLKARQEQDLESR